MCLCVQESIDDGAVVVILANKLDLVEEDVKQRAVSSHAGQSLAVVIILHISLMFCLSFQLFSSSYVSYCRLHLPLYLKPPTTTIPAMIPSTD